MKRKTSPPRAAVARAGSPPESWPAVISERRRSFALMDIESRADGGHPRLSGYAAVFNSPSQPITEYGFTFREQIAPGAFAESIARALSNPDDPIIALWNHCDDDPIGSTANGSLAVSEDERGLKVDLKPPPTTCGDDVVTLITQRYVSKMSFRFQVPVGGDSWDYIDSENVRTLRKVNLIEVSPVVWPAYRQTDIGARIAQLAGVELRAIDGASARLESGTATHIDRELMRRVAAQLLEKAGPTAAERAQIDRNRRKLRLLAAA